MWLDGSGKLPEFCPSGSYHLQRLSALAWRTLL